jgi:acyl transferase domain-containing protein/acyl carrier protein
MPTGLEIAVIGMACRFPGARNPAQFWDNLRDGTESITFFTAQELTAAGVSPQTLADPAYVRAQGLIPDAELFDAGFFTLSPKEADIMDPQHRILLECAWEALEDSGYDPARVTGPVGVYAGSYYNTYLPYLPPVPDAAEQFARNIANEKDYLATRLAYKLDLTGPALTVQTACSTSLVAVHLAAQGLLSGACDLALAGGATVRARQVAGYHFQVGGIFSSDGHCRAFDARAEGTVASNGAGMVLLKRLADALADGDTVHAVIRGSAIGNDGADRIGFTAPGVAGQARVIHAAQAMAEVDPATVTYVETHGSGTPLGDPIEVEALTRVFRAGGAATGACAIGSVKTNIGHTHAASGIAGLIKTVLAIEHGQIPPSLHFERPNPAIDFTATPFRVNTELTGWGTDGGPRRAGVSSFGMGGTDAHVVLEEAPSRPVRRSTSAQLVPISAGTLAALDTATGNLADHLDRHRDLDLADVAHTLRVGRRGLAHRRIVVATSSAEAIEVLRGGDPRRVPTGTPGTADRSVAFIFPGLGDQRPGMGSALYRSQPLFRAAVERCADALRPYLGLDLRTLLYPESPYPQSSDAAPGTGIDLRRMLGRDGGSGTDPSGLDQTRYAHPAVFVTEYALAELWMGCGVRPTALIGYSLGEYVAACVSGVLSLDDALRLVVRRSQLIAELPPGAMLAVPASVAEVTPLLVDGASVAAVNGRALCVVAGQVAAIDELQERLTARGMAVRRLPTSHAFHSPMMDAIAEPFADLVGSVPLHPPRIPYVSNVTGTWVTAQEATDPAYWGRHLRQAVQFADGVTELWKEPRRLLLELGPGQSLGSLALQLRPADTRRSGTEPATLTLSSLPGAFERQPEDRFFLGTAGKLWLAGVDLDWSAFASRRPRRVPLPTYPFQRRRHWVEAVPSLAKEAPSLAKKADVTEWFHVPAWAPLPPHPRQAADPGQVPGPWLLFVDDCGVGAALVAALATSGRPVTVVSADPEPGTDTAPDTDPEPGTETAAWAAGGRLRRLDAGHLGVDHYAMPPGAGDYARLLSDLRKRGRYPDRIVHLWTVDAGTAGHDTGAHNAGTANALRRGFFSLLALARALGGQPDTERVELVVVSSDMQAVTGAEAIRPEKATLLGPCRVLPLEHPHVACRSIDITVPAEPAQRHQASQHLLAELLAPAGQPVVALRGHRRWHQIFQPLRLGPGEPPGPLPPGPLSPGPLSPGPLPRGRNFLITGGLGGIGLTLARQLARTEQAGLALVARTTVPPREEWAEWLTGPDADDETCARIRAIQEIEALGARVLPLVADVSDPAQLRAAAAIARERIGPVHGIIHAAGVAGGGLIQLKSEAAAGRVLAPKVYGGLAVEEIARELGVAFVALCSSTLAITGGVGQVDYVAANAFLDALAQRSAAAGGPNLISINWDAWQDVGMAFRNIGTGDEPTGTRVGPVEHPLLDACLTDEPSHAVYRATFSVATSWLVDEHRMLGDAVVPGTGHLELARAAFADLVGGGAVNLLNVRFYAPVVVAEDEVRELRVVLDKTTTPVRFTVVSRYRADDAEGRPRWQVHAVGEVAAGAPAQREFHDLAGLIASGRLTDLGRPVHTGPMGFGPRSRCLRRVWLGEKEALAELELPEQFAADLDHLNLHPSLLDLGAGFVGMHLAEEFRIPISYGRLQCLRPLPRRVFSLHRYRDVDRAGKETISADIVLLDADGQELVRIDEFVLKRVPALRETLDEARDGGSAEVAFFRYPQLAAESGPTGSGLLAAHLANGIRPEEGADAFARIVAGAVGPQVLVVAKDLAAVIADVAGARLDPEAAISTPPPVAHPRPNMLTPYRAPSDELEQRLADVWQDLLGVERIGVDDVFVELGGHSLLGLELVNRLRRSWGVEISLGALFEAHTVADLANVLRPVVEAAGLTSTHGQGES